MRWYVPHGAISQTNSDEIEYFSYFIWCGLRFSGMLDPINNISRKNKNTQWHIYQRWVNTSEFLFPNRPVFMCSMKNMILTQFWPTFTLIRIARHVRSHRRIRHADAYSWLSCSVPRMRVPRCSCENNCADALLSSLDCTIYCVTNSHSQKWAKHMPYFCVIFVWMNVWVRSYWQNICSIKMFKDHQNGCWHNQSDLK